MSTDLKQREAACEHEARLLDGLPALAPSDATRDRIRNAMRHEAARVGRQRRVLRLGQTLGAAAAAVVLAVLLHSVPSGPIAAPSIDPAIDPEAYVDDWLAAVDMTNDRMVTLFEDPWRPTMGGGDDVDAAVQDMLDGLDSALSEGI